MDQNHIRAGFVLPHPPVIIPQVGKGDEMQAAATVAAMNRISELTEKIKPDTVVLISPHAPLFRDYVFIYDSQKLKGSFLRFGCDLEKEFAQDTELRKKIEEGLNDEGIPAGSMSNADQSLDHGTMVPLIYMSSKYNKFRLVALSPSGMGIKQLSVIGKVIKDAAKSLDRKIIVAASGDMSHKVNRESPYGACKEGGQFDKMVVDMLRNGDLLSLSSIDETIRERAAECGFRPLVILSGAFGTEPVKTEVLSYEAPFGIGYCVASIIPCGQEQSIHVKIAKKTLDSYVKTGKVLTALDLQPEIEMGGSLLNRPAGVFVSLKKSGELRGCIGTILPATDCIAKEIIQNAIEAGIHDPRFDPVAEDELDKINYNVDVLSTPVPAETKEELDPKIYGVIVEKGWRRGLLLPDLDGIETVDEQLRIACMKAGIDPNNDKYSIKKFTVTRFE